MDPCRRDLERRARAGDPDAAAAHLQARVRAGELPSGCVTLAAYLGHEPAARLLDRKVPHAEDSIRWFSGLPSFGDQVLARACVAATRETWNVAGETPPASLDGA